jgi:myo-inositol-1(or 4)-monophosphatase
LQVLIKAAKNAGEILNKYFTVAQRMDTKDKTNQRDLVTVADGESQEMIRKTITEMLVKDKIPEKEIGFIGEENLNVDGKHMFIIDPLDGTTDFACGLPFFCVSIAYAYNGELKAGVIFNPIDKTLYSAELGKGSKVVRNGISQNLKMTPESLRNCLASIHINSPEAWERARKFNEKIRGMRDIGSIALETAMMAEGIFNMVYCTRCYIWDMAAVSVIVSEAGGKIFELNGQDWKPDFANSRKQLEVIGAHKNKVAEFLEELKSE